MFLYTLHGFLGLPSDWDFLKGVVSFEAAHLFADFSPKEGLKAFGQSFNQKIQRDLKNSKIVLSKRILAGYSLGGRLALQALIEAPSLWDAALIISAHPGLTSEEERSKRRLQDLIWAQKIKEMPWEEFLASWNEQSVFGGNIYPNKLKSWDSSLTKASGFNFPKSTPYCNIGSISEVESRELSLKSETNFSTCLGICARKEKDFDKNILSDVLIHWSLGHQEDLREVIRTLPMPILWVVGEKDQKFLEVAKTVFFQHPRSSILSVPASSHRVLFEQPNVLKKNFLDFLYRVA